MRIHLVGEAAEHEADLRPHLAQPLPVATLPAEAATSTRHDHTIEPDDVVVSLRFRRPGGQAPPFRLLHVPGAGLDGIDLDTLHPGTAVANVFEHEGPIAEFVLARMLEWEIRAADMQAAFTPQDSREVGNTSAVAAALVFATLFFPGFSPSAGLIAAFATFGVGYFARPLGALVFGHIGDRYGRRASLIGTLLLMGVATVLIGLLPTYAAIGLLAPILLVICRLLQGLAVGAEYVGAVTMVAEFAPTKRRGYYASIPACGVFLGIGLAAAVSGVVALLPKDQLMSWGWRIPFLLSIVVVGVGLLIRLRVPESPVFAGLKAARARTKVPALEMIKAMPGRLLLVMVANGPLAFNIYVIQTFSLSYLAKHEVAKSTSLFALLVGCAAGAIAIPFVGRLSDRVGRKPVYLVVCLFCAAISFPFFWLLDTGNTALILLAFALALGGGCLAMFGSQAAFYAELFPAAYRFSGFALGREIPGAVLAGPAPIVAVGLVAAADGSTVLISAALAVVALAAAAAAAALAETRGKPLAPMVARDDARRPVEQT